MHIILHAAHCTLHTILHCTMCSTLYCTHSTPLLTHLHLQLLFQCTTPVSCPYLNRNIDREWNKTVFLELKLLRLIICNALISALESVKLWNNTLSRSAYKSCKVYKTLLSVECITISTLQKRASWLSEKRESHCSQLFIVRVLVLKIENSKILTRTSKFTSISICH